MKKTIAGKFPNAHREFPPFYPGIYPSFSGENTLDFYSKDRSPLYCAKRIGGRRGFRTGSKVYSAAMIFL